jgi:hypothetical protein
MTPMFCPLPAGMRRNTIRNWALLALHFFCFRRLRPLTSDGSIYIPDQSRQCWREACDILDWAGNLTLANSFQQWAGR